MRTARAAAHDIWWGVRLGFQVGVIFSIIAIIMSGLAAIAPGPKATLPLSLMVFFGVYFTTGILGGVVLGIGRPWLVTRLGANVVASIAAVPWYFSARVLVRGWGRWSVGDVLMVSVCAVALGTIVSQVLWNRRLRRLAAERPGDSPFRDHH